MRLRRERSRDVPRAAVVSGLLVALLSGCGQWRTESTERVVTGARPPYSPRTMSMAEARTAYLFVVAPMNCAVSRHYALESSLMGADGRLPVRAIPRLRPTMMEMSRQRRAAAEGILRRDWPEELRGRVEPVVQLWAALSEAEGSLPPDPSVGDWSNVTGRIDALFDERTARLVADLRVGLGLPEAPTSTEETPGCL